jgi:hypothetical protein
MNNLQKHMQERSISDNFNFFHKEIATLNILPWDIADEHAVALVVLIQKDVVLHPTIALLTLQLLSILSSCNPPMAI